MVGAAPRDARMEVGVLRALPVVAMLLASGPQSATAQDAVAGEAAFRKCLACHAVGEAAAHKIGPVLNGVVGRAAATQEGFYYSSFMTAAGADGLVWTEQALSLFLANPREFLPGTSMTFAGVRNEAERANIIAYLTTLSPDYVPPARTRNPAPPAPRDPPRS